MRDRNDRLLVTWTLAAKVAVLAIGVVAVWITTGGIPDVLEPWQRWDAPHLTDIALWGYMADDPGNLAYPGYAQAYPGELDLYIVFFPLFPWLTGLLTLAVRDPVLAAFLVATVASLFVAPLLYRLVAADLGKRIGLGAAAFLLVFPTAYFLHIGYTEALFLALAFGSLWLARTERWWAAGLLGLLAALTRVNGLILIPTLAVEAWLQWRGDRRIRLEWLAIAGPAIGIGIYLWLNWSVYGDPFMFSRIQSSWWFKELSPPWEGIASIFDWLDHENPDSAFMIGWMELAFTALGLVASIATAIWMRPTWGAWMIGNWLLIVSTGFVMSVPRYSLVLFGIYAWAALIADRWRVVGWVLGIASALAMGYFTWRFATGLWAF